MKFVKKKRCKQHVWGLPEVDPYGLPVFRACENCGKRIFAEVVWR